MAVTENSYTGNGSTTNYSFTFPYLKATDIEVQVNASVVTTWSLANATTVQFNSAPSNGDKIKILRQTSVDELAATFYAGSAIKSEDLNDNYTQNLYKTQEVGNRFFSNTGGTMTGDLTMGEDTGLIFEGATDDAYETTLGVVDPTADRAVNLPNEDGTLIVSSSTSTVNVGSKDIHTTGDIDLEDDSKIKLGSSDDLEIHHTGVNAFIDNDTGHLYIQNTGSNDNSNIYIKARNEDDSIICKDDGSIELYYNNNKKFETSGSGATVTGTLTADSISLGDSDKLFIGNSDDLTLWHNGVNSYIDTIASGHLFIRANTTGSGGNIYIQAQSGEQSIVCNDNGAVILYNNNSKKFETTAAGATVTGVLTATVTGDVTGNASTATALETARTLGGVSFDGTANINLPGVNTAGNQNTSGNAATATALANARTIGGVSFDGTANINLPGVNAGGNQDTSGNAATATAATALATSRDFSATGEVTASAVGFTGSGNVALSTVISSNIVDEDNLKISNSGSDGQYLQKQSGNAGGLTWASPGGGTATAIATVNEATDTTCFPLFGTSATGDLQPKTNANLTFNSNTGAFTAADISIPNDTGKLKVGTSDDLSVYHDGTNSFIANTTGILHLRSDNGIRLQDSGGVETFVKCVDNGAVELYYDNVKRLQTTASGIQLEPTANNHGITLKSTGELYPAITFDVNRSGSDQYLGNIKGTWNGTIVANILFETGDDTTNKDNGLISFRTAEAGSTAERLRITQDGQVKIPDDGKFVAGGGGDLEIYHDGTDSKIFNHTGTFKINANDFLFQDKNEGDTFVKYVHDGAVELYYDGVKKCYTGSNGLHFGDDDKILLGNSSDFEIYHTSTSSWIRDVGTGVLYIDTNGDSINLISDGSNTYGKMGVFKKDGAVELYYDNGKKFHTTNGGVEVEGSCNLYSNAAHDEGHIHIQPRSTAADNDRVWIGCRDNDTAKYRFQVDGDGQIRSNSTHFIGVQREDADVPTTHFNSADRIRYNSYRGTSDNSGYRSRAIFGVASSDYDDYRVLYYVDAQDDAAVDYDADQRLSMSGSGRVQGKHHFFSGRVESDEATPNSVYAGAERGFYAYADDGTDYTFIHARNVADTSMVFESRVNNEVNVEIEADGSARTDGTWSDTNADYAECFEWTDGNASDQERRGMTVVLDGEKVKLATDSDNKDNIIGVVSPEPVVLGDAAPLGWHGRYKKDAYGSPIKKEQEWLIWKKEYHYKDGVKTLVDQPDPNKPQTLRGDIDRVRVENIEREKAAGIIPDFAITNNIRYKTYGKDIDTTTYDPTKAYIPRKDRKEWDAIGMVGKLVVRRGQPVGTRWLLMKENIGTDTDGTVLDRYLVR